jgi:hypothetical protein
VRSAAALTRHLASLDAFDPLEHTMYDMYPDWGPARHRDYDYEPALQSVQSGLDLRDNGGQRPDDN